MKVICSKCGEPGSLQTLPHTFRKTLANGTVKTYTYNYRRVTHNHRYRRPDGTYKGKNTIHTLRVNDLTPTKIKD